MDQLPEDWSARGGRRTGLGEEKKAAAGRAGVVAARLPKRNTMEEIQFDDRVAGVSKWSDMNPFLFPLHGHSMR